MTDMSSVGGVVKILESPKHKIFKDNISTTFFRVQFPQARKASVVHLKFWGNLANDVLNYYKVNDYILIEGYLSLKDKKTLNSPLQKIKKVEITVFKIYPFLLTYDRSKIGTQDR
jgi:hypothetical protein